MTNDFPLNIISPWLGSYIPDIILTNVVLPAPLWPKRQNISFENNSPLKLSTAFNSSKFFDTFIIFKQAFCSFFCLFIGDNS